MTQIKIAIIICLMMALAGCATSRGLISVNTSDPADPVADALQLLTIHTLEGSMMPEETYDDLKTWFVHAKVGARVTLLEKCGCNSCSRSVEKVSETHIHDYGIGWRTLINCGPDYTVVEVK